MTAKQQAIRDIRKSLRSEGKVFIAYNRMLDPVMEELVNEQCEAQEKKTYGSNH